ncbi:MAG TPA: Hsp20/alpha crystallin family protein [Blastocatellia bacterium]|nr:Hsp20/alpha crystallin family protein [Blastocatellia bacterium]
MARREDLLLFISHGASLSEGRWIPAADVYRTPDGWMIKVELAGTRPSDIELCLEGSHLHVRGVRRDTENIGECYQMEIVYGPFERVITLPFEVRPRVVETEYINGLLIIRLLCDEGD